MRYTWLLLVLCGSAVWAQLAPEVDPAGALTRVTMGERVVAQNVLVKIIKRGWSGDLARQGEPGAPMTATTEGGVRVFRGQFPAEGKPVAFEQRLETTPQEIRLRWKLTPSAELSPEAVLVFAELPVAGNAGQGTFLIGDGDVITERPLPAELPSPYHLAGSGTMAWCAWALPGGTGLRFVPDGQGITGVSFQDNRQFKMDTFQAQFAVAGTSLLKAGQTYEFGLTLRPFDQAALAAERKSVIDPEKALVVPLTSAQPLKLRGVKASAAQVPAYGRVELTLDLDATYDNPFDPADIAVDAVFTGPGKREVRVPGFFYQGYEWYGKQPLTRLRTVGKPTWKVRFSPPAPGVWTGRVTVRDRSGEVNSAPVKLTATAAKDPGFVRRTPGNPYYLQFDNGKPYFPIGENICWPQRGTMASYAEWFPALGKAGGNYARLWMVRWNLGLEWMPGKGTGAFYGVGKYALDNAYRMDWLMDQARANGIYCMPALGYHGELMNTKAFFGENCWEDNPYNQANGGPCADPKEFWTNEQARKLYQQRLRYLVARWGWESHLMSWELWNEVNAPAPWVKEMAGYLKAHDPSGHLVTTTYGNDEVWKLDEMDYTQDHSYGSDENRRYVAAAVAASGRAFTTRWPKPFSLGEFGIDFKTSDRTHDPQGRATALHDALWASVMSRQLGAAATWWWDGYIHPLNLYREFTALKRFTDTVPWTKFVPELAEFEPATVQVNPDTPWADLHLRPSMGWAKQREGDLILNPDGSLGGSGACASILFSPSKPDMLAPLRFRVTYPRDGKLILHVNQVSQGAVLHVAVDGQEVWTQDLPCGEGEGPWKKPFYSEVYKIWQNFYDRDYEVPIPAGAHVIEISNTGKDWVEVSNYTFTGVCDPRYARTDALGLRTPQLTLVWLHDQESNWYNDKYDKLPRPQLGLQTAVRGLPDGRYRIEWWDTRQGKALGSSVAASREGKLPLAPPTFTRDIAARIVPVK